MTQATQCSVCSEPAEIQAFELSFCQRCYDAPAEAPGTNIEVSNERRDEIDQISVTFVHEVRIRVTLGKPAEVSIKLSHEGLGHRLIKVFKDEYQAGDAAFDDAIYIADVHRASTEKLLARAGARKAILALVKDKNQVNIDHGNIDFEAHDQGQTDLLSYLRAALALSRHIVAIG